MLQRREKATGLNLDGPNRGEFSGVRETVTTDNLL